VCVCVCVCGPKGGGGVEVIEQYRVFHKEELFPGVFRSPCFRAV
jgi:hypothetical protein